MASQYSRALRLSPALCQPRLHLTKEGAHVALLAVAVVVAEHQAGDVIFAEGVAVEHVATVAVEDAAAADVVEQPVAVGNAAVALQQTGTDESGNDLLDVTVAHGGVAFGNGFLDGGEHTIGAVRVRHLVVGEGHGVAGAELTVDIVGQRVGNEAQSLTRELKAKPWIAVAVDEGLLVEAVGTRPQQWVGFSLAAASRKEQNQAREE